MKKRQIINILMGLNLYLIFSQGIDVFKCQSVGLFEQEKPHDRTWL